MMLFSIRTSIDHGFVVFFAWVPRVVGFVAVLLIGYIIAKTVGSLVFRLTHRAGLDQTVHSGTGGNVIQRAVPAPSRLLGKITFWAIFLGALSIAASVLGIKALTAFVGTVWAYIPNVIAALLIFLIAGAIAGAVVALVKRVMGDTALGKIVATAVPILVMTIAVFMILVQLKIAIQIVTITYAAIWGAIALAAALAFGLGGREVAGRMLEGAYQKGQENKQRYKQELVQAKERATKEAQQIGQDGQKTALGATSRPQPEPGR
jgi:hypothetical protein